MNVTGFSSTNCIMHAQYIIRRLFFQDEIKRKTTAPGGARTPDLRITSAPSAVHASTAYKYDALTDSATGAP